MKIGICGGAGFVGRHLALHLSNQHQVVVLDSLVRRGSELALPEFAARGIAFSHGDARCRDDLDALAGCEVVLECSAQPSAVSGFSRPRDDFEHNVVGLFNVLEWCRGRGVGLIFWSTNKVYSGKRINRFPYVRIGDRYVVPNDFCMIDDKCCLVDGKDQKATDESFPLDGGDKSVYGATKAAADLLCQEYASAFGLPVIVNRCSCLAGTHQWGMAKQGWVAWFAIAAHLGLPIEVCGWEGCQVRDVLFAPDLCRLVEKQIAIMSTGWRPREIVHNVGGGPGEGFSTSPLEILELLDKKFWYKFKFAVLPEARKSDHRVYISDIRRAKETFGWEPRIKVEQGLEEIVKWVRDNGEQLRRMYGSGSVCENPLGAP